MKINILERIERRTERMADGECWVNDYATTHNGYTSIDGGRRQHRIAWEAHHAEPIPEGMVVAHTCDNRQCFNPEHLFICTQQENIQDSIEKGRFDHIHLPPNER